MLWMVLTSLTSADCGDPAALVDAALDALVQVRLERASDHLQQAEASFGCGSPPSKDLLAKFWITEGALLHLQGSQQAADSFAAAARLDAASWDPRLGPALRAAFEGAATADSTGILILKPAATGLRVDTVEAVSPATVIAGLHLVQVVEDDTVLFGRMVYALDEQEALIRLDPLPQHDQAPKRPPIFGIVSAVSLAAGAGMLGGSLAQNGAMKRAEDLNTLDAALARQRAFSGAAYGLTGLSATTLFMEVAF